MIEMDLDKPIPYISELKKVPTDAQLEEAIDLLKIDPTCDDDLHLWFAIQRSMTSLGAEGGGGVAAIAKERANVLPNHKKPLRELLSMARGVILKDYWVDRRDWDLKSLVGGYEKLNHTDGDVGLELLKKHFEPTSKNMVIRSCSSSKPYDMSPTIRQVMGVTDRYDCELAVASYVPTPMSVCRQYPFAFYQGTMWDAVRGPSEWMPFNVKKFFDYFHYDKLLVYTKPKQLPTMKQELDGHNEAIYLEANPAELLPNCKNSKTAGILSSYYYSITRKMLIKMMDENFSSRIELF